MENKYIKMEDHNRLLAQEYLNLIATRATPEKIATLFTEDLEWEVPGDAAAFPWVGRKYGRAVVEEFTHEERRLLERVGFEVDEILASHERAVILAHFKTIVKATGKLIDSPLVIILQFRERLISKFTLVEDSFGVSQAAKK